MARVMKSSQSFSHSSNRTDQNDKTGTCTYLCFVLQNGRNHLASPLRLLMKIVWELLLLTRFVEGLSC